MVFFLALKVAFGAIFTTCLTKFKYSNKKAYTLIALTNLIIIGVNYIIYSVKGTQFLSNFSLITVSLPALISFYIISNLSFIKVFFSFLISCNFCALLTYIGFLSQILFKNLFLTILIQLLVFILILIYILKVFRKEYFEILSILDKGWLFLCSIPLLFLIIIYLLQYYPTVVYSRTYNIPVISLIFILMFVFYTILCANFKNISDYYELKINKDFMSLQIDMQKKEYVAFKDKLTSIEIYRHDMRHHILTINTLLSNNNIFEAQEYLKKLKNDLSNTTIIKYCENYTINTILSTYIKRAEDEKISITTKISVPENITIDNIELASIFSNAIDNAIIACMKIPDFNNRKIDIVCKEHHNQLYIQLCNTFIGAVKFNGNYPISSNKNHGFGTQSIIRIVEKYNGIWSFTIDNNVFKTTVILKY